MSIESLRSLRRRRRVTTSSVERIALDRSIWLCQTIDGDHVRRKINHRVRKMRVRALAAQTGRSVEATLALAMYVVTCVDDVEYHVDLWWKRHATRAFAYDVPEEDVRILHRYYRMELIARTMFVLRNILHTEGWRRLLTALHCGHVAVPVLVQRDYIVWFCELAAVSPILYADCLDTEYAPRITAYLLQHPSHVHHEARAVQCAVDMSSSPLRTHDYRKICFELERCGVIRYIPELAAWTADQETPSQGDLHTHEVESV